LPLAQALELALRLHPAGKVAAELAEASRAAIGVAQSGYYPRVFFGAEWVGGSINGNPAAFLGFPDFPRISGASPSQRSPEEQAKNASDLSPWGSYLAGLSAAVPIWDFGRTHGRVRQAEGNARELEASQRTVRDRIVLGVQRAYYGVLAAERMLRVAEEMVHRLELHATRAREMVLHGLRARIDVARTEAEVARGRLRLIAATNDLQVARVVLDNAIGEPVHDRFELVDETAEERLVGTLDDFLSLARRMRPELRELDGRRASMEGRVETARAGLYPAFAATASVSMRGVGGVGNWPNYDAGLVMAWPVFDGFLYRRQEEEARARLRSLRAAEDELGQRIELEVRAAYASRRSARESIHAARVAARHAKDNLEMATGRFEQGLGQIIELADAEELYSTAEANVVRAIYDYKLAAAALERAVGREVEKRAPKGKVIP
jgi:outer membrane protein TolC